MAKDPRSLRRPPRTVPLRAMVAGVLAVSTGAGVVEAEDVTFAIDDIDLGSIERIGDLNWSHTLGTTWDEDFRIGGIVGHQNATVIPEIRDPFFGNVIIPRVTADTRTGAQFTGNVSGGTGLHFFADFQASGLSAGNAFDFRPSVETPTNITSGEFFKLNTHTGMVNNAAFNKSAVDLPSFQAGMNFFFDLEMRSRIEAGLFPIAPYSSSNFNPTPIHVNQSLLKFEFDLDPDSNPDSEAGVPPTFTIFDDTPFESSVGFLDDSASVASKQISVEVEVKDQPNVKRRLDIGEVQLVNPFGVGESILGGSHPNLTISTSMNEAAMGYSFETPLLRLGLDLDGIASFLGTGQSFTRIEEEIGDFAEITADLIDIKYGPEIGYRESVEVKPDFEVTLNFDRDVVVRSDTGVTITDSLSGLWSDLPEFAMLGLDPVEVEVNFDRVTGTQSKRSAFFLTDYLELTLLELEDLTILDTLSLSLPPLLQERTSVLGALLGEVELTIDQQTQTITPFDLAAMPGAGFTLHAAPSPVIYPAGEFLMLRQIDQWRQLSDGAAPGSFGDKTLYIGVDAGGGAAPATTADLHPAFVSDYGDSIDDGTATIAAQRLILPAGASLFQYSGQRIWEVPQIINDGHLESYGFTQFGGGSISVLQITGEGSMLFTTGEATFHAPVLVHGPGHTMTFDGTFKTPGPPVYADSGPLHHIGDVVNAGELIYRNLRENTTANLANTETGVVRVQGATGIIDWWGDVANTGLMIAEDGARMSIDDAGTTTLTAPGGNGRFEARSGALIEFVGETQLGTSTSLNLSAPRASDRLSFVAGAGSTVRFDQPLQHRFDINSHFETEVGGTLALNGIQFPSMTNIPSSSWDEVAAIASDFIEVVNRGTLTIESGENFLFLTGTPPLNPGAPPPTPQPVITPLNLVNTGEVVIQSGAKFGFEVEIENYTEGGAVFDQGKWTLIGATPASSFSNLTPLSSVPAGAAVLDLRVVQVSNDDSYIGTVFFGDGNAIQDFDTRLVTNASDITLSGQALFPYLNTIEENRGSLVLSNSNYFTLLGDLANTGTLRVENRSQLNIDGNLTVDQGTVFVDLTSGLSVGPNTIEVIGGNVTVQRDGALNLNTPWIIREKWVGVDANGDDIILEGRVSYGDAHFSRVGPNADILLEGERAVFEPLAGISRVEGKLTLAAGNELRLAQSLTNVGTLTLADAGKLYVDGDMLNTGQLTIGTDSYLDVSEAFTATGGSIRLDGVLHAAGLALSPGTALTGGGRFTGSLISDGTLAVGNSAGIMEIFDGLNQSSAGSLELELLGQTAGVGYDQLILHGDSSVDGTLILAFGGDFVAEMHRQWLLVDVRDDLSTGELSEVVWSIDNLTTIGLDPFTGELPEGFLMRDPSDQVLGAFAGEPVLLSYRGGAGNSLIVYSVPEPGSLGAFITAGLLLARRRRRQG